MNMIPLQTITVIERDETNFRSFSLTCHILVDILFVSLYIRSKDPGKSHLYRKMISDITGNGCILLLMSYLIPQILQ